jgi:hypothetical protein
MLSDASTEVSADTTRSADQKQKIFSLLAGATDDVKSMTSDWISAPKQTQDFPQWAEVRLTQIVNLLSQLGADGIKTFRNFKGQPLDKRYLPPGYDVRNKLYLNSSGWSANRASVISSGGAAVALSINKVITFRLTDPAQASDAWNTLVKGLQVPDGANQANLSTAQLAATQYDVDHIQPLSIHWQSGGGNNADDASRWAMSADSNLRYITHRDNIARDKGSYVGWVGPAFISANAQGGLANAKAIDGQPFLDATGKPI